MLPIDPYNMSAPARDYYSVSICSIRTIWQNPQIAQATTLRDPWIPARSKDP